MALPLYILLQYTKAIDNLASICCYMVVQIRLCQIQFQVGSKSQASLASSLMKKISNVYFSSRTPSKAVAYFASFLQFLLRKIEHLCHEIGKCNIF